MITKYSFMNIGVDPKIEELKNLKADEKTAGPTDEIKTTVKKLSFDPPAEKSIKALNMEKK